MPLFIWNANEEDKKIDALQQYVEHTYPQRKSVDVNCPPNVDFA